MDFKRSIQVAKKMNATNEEVWNVISQPSHLELTHPFASKNSVVSWPGEGSKDILVYLSGLRYERDFIVWNEGIGYTLKIGGRTGKKSKVVWEISSEGEATFLSISIYPHFMATSPRLISSLPYRLLIEPKLRSYLNSVLGGIDYYLVEKKSVPRNHFGKHKWFS